MPRIRTATASTASNNRPSASSTAATATGRSKKRVRPLDSSDDDGIFPGKRSGKSSMLHPEIVPEIVPTELILSCSRETLFKLNSKLTDSPADPGCLSRIRIKELEVF